VVKYAFDTNVFIEAARDVSAEAAMLKFLKTALPFTFLSAVVMQELAAGARTTEQARQLDETVFAPFTRRDRYARAFRAVMMCAGESKVTEPSAVT
jgi:predicted nucleic acid-binding protein